MWRWRLAPDIRFSAWLITAFLWLLVSVLSSRFMFCINHQKTRLAYISDTNKSSGIKMRQRKNFDTVIRPIPLSRNSHCTWWLTAILIFCILYPPWKLWSKEYIHFPDWEAREKKQIFTSQWLKLTENVSVSSTSPNYQIGTSRHKLIYQLFFSGPLKTMLL